MGTLLLTVLEETNTNHQQARMSVKQVVTFTIKKEEMEKFKVKAAEVVSLTKKNPDCIECNLCKQIGVDGENYVIIETWKDEATCDADTEGPHVKQFLQEMGDSISLDIKKFTKVC